MELLEIWLIILLFASVGLIAYGIYNLVKKDIVAGSMHLIIGVVLVVTFGFSLSKIGECNEKCRAFAVAL